MRGDPRVFVTCDRCLQYSEELRLTLTARGWNDRNVDTDLEDAGWKLEPDADICPNCQEDTDDA